MSVAFAAGVLAGCSLVAVPGRCGDRADAQPECGCARGHVHARSVAARQQRRVPLPSRAGRRVHRRAPAARPGRAVRAPSRGSDGPSPDRPFLDRQRAARARGRLRPIRCPVVPRRRRIPRCDVDLNDDEPRGLADPQRRRPVLMRVVVTGGAGFVGRAIVAPARDRGDTVVALVRDPAKAALLAALGAELVAGRPVRRRPASTGILRGADGAIHAAGSYRVGIPAAEQPAMWDANVGTTTRFLDAADGRRRAAHRLRLDVNVFGNTHGRHRRRDLPAGPRRGLPHLVRRDQVPGPRGRGGADRRRGAHRHRACPARSTVPATTRASASSCGSRYEGKLPYRALGGVADRAGPLRRPRRRDRRGARPGQARRGVQPRGADDHAGEAVAIAAQVGGKRAAQADASRTGSCALMAPLGGLDRPAEPARGRHRLVGRDLLRDRGQGGGRARLHAAVDLEQGFRDTFAKA